MGFEVSARAYGSFMGRFSEPLAEQFVEQAALQPGDRVLDVGCGPGALTQRLVDRLGAEAVSAIDPSQSFVDAIRDRLPGVDVREAAAEHLPFADDAFAAAFAQLVVHFMADPVAGLREMRRVTRPGGVVAASVWDHAGGRGPLSVFWQAVRDIDPQATTESGRAGSRSGQLAELCADAGLSVVESTSLTVHVRFQSVAEWWEPYTLGVGPVGEHVASLDPPRREQLRTRCGELLPSAPFDLPATAWCVRAHA